MTYLTYSFMLLSLIVYIYICIYAHRYTEAREAFQECIRMCDDHVASEEMKQNTQGPQIARSEEIYGRVWVWVWVWVWVCVGVVVRVGVMNL